MRNEPEPPADWNQQYKWDRELLLAQQSELANKHDKLCDEVHKNTIDIAIMWTKVAMIALVAGVVGGFLGTLAVGLIKYLPAIAKALQTTTK